MLERFTKDRIKTENAEIVVRHAGEGPPLVLLHGHPETGVMWQNVAPDFTDRFTVFIPDLRGCGESDGPRLFQTKHYSKRAMATDVIRYWQNLATTSSSWQVTIEVDESVTDLHWTIPNVSSGSLSST